MALRGLVIGSAAIGLSVVGRRLAGRLRPRTRRDHVALVTGGSRGLGFLIARELVRAGCRVAICGRDPGALSAAAAELGREGEILAVPADVADRRAVEQLVAQTLDRFGRIDVLVNNAGLIEVGLLDVMSVEDFARAMDVMFWGMLHATLALLPHMRARGSGRIVNITSIGGKLSVPHLLPYGCVTFAAVGLSEGLRAELRRDGIRVVTVVPGLMRTADGRTATRAASGGEVHRRLRSPVMDALTTLGRTAARRFQEHSAS